jgi:cytochrome c oxidase subunit 2
MAEISKSAAKKILIASANPLFSAGLVSVLRQGEKGPGLDIFSVFSMVDTLKRLETWHPDLVIVDYDDQTINRAEFLNHFVNGDWPMQVMLVSLKASGAVVVYDRKTLTPAQAEDWLGLIFTKEPKKRLAASEED